MISSFLPKMSVMLAALAEEVGYVKLPATMYEAARYNYNTQRAGTQFLDDEGEKIIGPLTEVYHGEIKPEDDKSSN